MTDRFTLSDDLVSRYNQAMMHTFGTPKRVFVKGEGARLWDAQGRSYTDLLAGIAVNSLGHNHPDVTRAITEQLGTLGHISNYFASVPQVALAERLAGFAVAHASEGTSARVFFTNSGTEANEAAFKIARLTGRPRIVAMDGSFHGRTMGSLSVTSNPKYRASFEPMPGGVTFVPYGDIEALAGELGSGDPVAAVVIEPIQGENGVVPAPQGFLAAAANVIRAHGALLWIDEVQTGIGRCGDWLASSLDGVVADVVTFAKGLGNGFPIGACVATGDAANLMSPGSHGSTFGGNPVAAAAGLAVIDVIERDGLLSHVRELGDWFAAEIEALGHPAVDHVRGRGLLRGIVLRHEIAPRVSDLALDAGFVINAPRSTALRVCPPLNISKEELRPFVDSLPALLDRANSEV